MKGYLLSRAWRDTESGIELEFWLATTTGPLQIIISNQQAVCFVDRETPLSLPQHSYRAAVNLQCLSTGANADAVYFRRQRDLNLLRQSHPTLLESDIKPADRFLMERFICAGVEVIGDMQSQQGWRSMHNPRMRALPYEHTLSALSLDIETRGHTDQLYSIAGTQLNAQEHDNRVYMIGEGAVQQRQGYTLHYAANETQLLQAFFKWLSSDIDPDILIGWSIINFDLSFLDKKCRQLGIPFAVGRGRSRATILDATNAGQIKLARIPGRAVLDGIDWLKAGFWAFESFALDHVASQMLQSGKLIQTSGLDKVAEINHLFQHDKPALADYNLQDCQLVCDIFDKANLIPFAMQRANLTGLALDRLGGSVAALDNLYLPRLHRKGYVANDINTEASTGLGSPGGYVLDSMPGLYQHVLVLDFKSLYPSIIRTFKIDPLGLAYSGDDPIEGFMGASFSRQQHILPALISELWQARDEAKRQKNQPLSQAIKIIMNSFYGVLGSNGCRFHSQQLASSITRRGHDIIIRSQAYIEAEGYQVIYGDTDSLFVHLGEQHNTQSANAIGQQLALSLNTWWKEALQKEHHTESLLEVEFETHYNRFLMPTIRGMSTGSKKRYAGLVSNDAGEHQLIIKGLEAVRTDWTPLAREFQKELFMRVFTNQPYEEFVRDTANAVLLGESNHLLSYRKRLRRKLSDYQRNVPPHVQAARKMQSPGKWVSYVITLNGPEPTEHLTATPDYQHYLDKQLAPAADSILYFLGQSFGSITDAQLQMF